MALIPYERHIRPFGMNLFKDLMDGGWSGNMMKADIREKDDAYVVEAEMPGVKKEDILLLCENGVLSISAKTDQEKTHEDDNYIRRERVTGEYYRSFALKDIDEENINAKLENGMLFVTLPKRAVKKEDKRIEIE